MFFENSDRGISQNVYVGYYVGNEEEMVLGKSYAELLEITHFHPFSYPLFLLVCPCGRCGDPGHFTPGGGRIISNWPKRLTLFLSQATR